MKILITGASGLLGPHFSEYLFNKGFDIYGIDMFPEQILDDLNLYPYESFYMQNIENL